MKEHKIFHQLLLTIQVVILLMASIFTNQLSAKNVEGEQSGTWTLANSPYVVQGDVTIPKGQSLTIEPGVVVKFAGYYRIKVKGTLIAKGNPDTRIIFTSVNDFEFSDTGDIDIRKISPKVDDWDMIEFVDDSDQQSSRISHCIIRYSANIIQCNNAAPIIRKIIITDCRNSQVFINGSVKSITQGRDNDISISKSSVSKAIISTSKSSSVLDDLLEGEEFSFGEIKVITASKKEEKVSDAPGVISVVTKDELEGFGGTTLKEILERVPSLIGSTVYMTDRSTIAPRGDQVMASSSHVLLLINGRPVREALEGGIKSEIYESFPVNIIEKIEVIRGPGSVLYGSNAFSAVINIITEKAKENSFTITGLTGTSGDYGTLGKVLLKSGDIRVVAAARYLKKADWETDFSYANYYGPIDTTVTVKTTIPNKGLGTYVGMSYKNLRFMGSYNEWKHSYFIVDYGTVIPIPTYGTCDWTKSFADLGYRLMLNDQWNMDFNITYTRSTFKTESWPSTNRDSYEIVAEWSNSCNPSERLGIVFGGLYNYFKGEEWGPLPPVEKFMFSDDSRYSVGAYTQLSYKLIKSLNVIAGVQANKVENIDLDIVPRAGIIWYPLERINVKTLYSQAFRAPSINEFSINFPEMQGNPDLTPEKVSTIDLGVNYQGEQIQTGINFFYSEQKDVIFQNRDTTVVPAPMYWNGVEVEFTGVELEGKYYVNRNLFLTGSMLYQTNKDQDGNENATPVANFGAKAGVSYKSEKGVIISLFNIYQGALDERFDTKLNPSPVAYNLMNFHCKFNMNKFFNWNLGQDISLVLQVDNLLDKEIWLPDWGLIIGKSMPYIQGRAIYLGIDAALK